MLRADARAAGLATLTSVAVVAGAPVQLSLTWVALGEVAWPTAFGLAVVGMLAAGHVAALGAGHLAAAWLVRRAVTRKRMAVGTGCWIAGVGIAGLALSVFGSVWGGLVAASALTGSYVLASGMRRTDRRAPRPPILDR